MAKMFYTAAEAAEKLGVGENDLKKLVHDGKLREFRDAGTVNYKVDDINKIVGGKGGAPAAPKAAPAKSAPVPVSKGSSAGSSMGSSAGSSLGEIILEPAEDSGIQLSPGGTDILKLDDGDAEDTAIGARSSKSKKEGTAVPSVGVNVFDDDELDEHVDPLAQTAVTDLAGIGLEGSGGGSGIMDLTRESDDTSLGRELLDEIYTGEERGGSGVGATPAKKGAKRAAPEDLGSGISAAEDATRTYDEEEAAAPVGMAAAVAPATHQRYATIPVGDFVPDPAATGLTGVMFVALFVLLAGFVAAAGMVRGVSPGLVSWIYANLMYAGIGAVVVAGLVGALTYMIAKKKSA